VISSRFIGSAVLITVLVAAAFSGFAYELSAELQGNGAAKSEGSANETLG
jgi:hypothetical protein